MTFTLPSTSAPWTALACALALALAGCAGGVYRDTFEGTRGALAAVQRHSGDAVDPETIQALTASAARGIREGAGLPADGSLFPELTDRVTYGAVRGIGRGLDDGTTRSTVALLDQLLRRVHGEGGPSLAAALLDDAPPRLERLSRGQLRLFREQLHLALVDTRGELALTTRDVGTELRGALHGNGDELALVLRRQVMPALGDGLRAEVAPAVEEVTRRATRGATVGLRQGIDDLRPSVENLRRSFFGERDNTLHWFVLGLVLALLILLGILGGIGYRRLMERARFQIPSVETGRPRAIRARAARRRRSSRPR